MGALVLEETTSVDNSLVTLLVDVSGIRLGTLWQFSTSDVRQGTCMWMDRYPVKLRRILIVNASSLVRGFFRTLVAPLLPSKMAARVLFVDSAKILHALVPASMLPQELKGCDGRLEGFDWKEMVERETWAWGGGEKEEGGEEEEEEEVKRGTSTETVLVL